MSSSFYNNYNQSVLTLNGDLIYSYSEDYTIMHSEDNEEFEAYSFNGKQCTSVEEYEKLSEYYKNRFTKADDIMTDCSEFTLEEFIQYIGANLN